MRQKRFENLNLPGFDDLFEGPPKQPRLRSNRTNVSTSQKPVMIREYLRLFVKVTKHGTYIDGFSGPQTETDNSRHWSALQVLEAQHEAFAAVEKEKQPPHLKHFYLFERVLPGFLWV